MKAVGHSVRSLPSAVGLALVAVLGSAGCAIGANEVMTPPVDAGRGAGDSGSVQTDGASSGADALAGDATLVRDGSVAVNARPPLDAAPAPDASVPADARVIDAATYVCGNGICEPGESGSTCGQDCCDATTPCGQSRQNLGAAFCRSINSGAYQWAAALQCQSGVSPVASGTTSTCAGTTVTCCAGRTWITATSCPSDTLSADQRIEVNKSVSSLDGRSHLAYQSDGNLVLYQDGVGALWSSNTATGDPGFAVLQGSDGNFVVYAGSGPAAWASNTGGRPGDGLVVQDDCNVVIYSAGGTALWATATSCH